MLAADDTGEGAVSPSRLTFTPTNYNIPQTVTIDGVNDTVYDGSQSWNVVLNPESTDTGYNALSNVEVPMTTTDNESAPRFSIGVLSVTEGDVGDSNNLTFTISLFPASESQHRVSYAEGNDGTATSGTDYTAVTAQTLTFDCGAD